MSIYDRAYAGCKGNRSDEGSCSATLDITEADLKAVKDITDPAKKMQALLDDAAAGCKEGCKCLAGDAQLVGENKIQVTSNDPTEAKPDFPKGTIS